MCVCVFLGTLFVVVVVDLLLLLLNQKKDFFFLSSWTLRGNEECGWVEKILHNGHQGRGVFGVAGMGSKERLSHLGPRAWVFFSYGDGSKNLPR